MTSARIATKPIAVVHDDHAPVQYESFDKPLADVYRYESLPSKSHFRLMTLAAGRHDDKLKCEITTYTLDGADVPPYSAVSYTWNESKFDRLVIAGKRLDLNDDLCTSYSVRHPLWCSTKIKPTTDSHRRAESFEQTTKQETSSSSRLLISTNLRDLLRRFRHPSKAKILWIDAVCINQDDLSERASQIMTMQRIYHVAEKVLFWTGEETDDSTVALGMLSKLEKVFQNLRNGSISRPQPFDLYNGEAMKSLGLPEYPSSRDWQALMNFYARPVFARVWIVQEIVAGINILLYCGGAAPMKFDVLFDATRLLHGVGWISTLSTQLTGGIDNTQFLAAIPSIKIGWMTEPSLELRQKQLKLLLRSTRIFAASDPRDKVFALIGLVNDYGHRDLHGVDRPHERVHLSSIQTEVQNAMPETSPHSSAKSDIELAAEILHTSNDPSIVLLKAIVVLFLDAGMRITSAFLSPSPLQDTEAFRDQIQEDVEEVGSYLGHFGKTCVRKSEHHDRVGDFACQVLLPNMENVLAWFKVMMQLTYLELEENQKTSTGKAVLKEVSRLDEKLRSILDSLNNDLATSNNSKGKVSVLSMGSHPFLDSLNYSSDNEPHFHDWAWSAAGRIVPDYRKPVVEVYTEFAVKCMQDSSSLDLLGTLEDRSTRKVQDLPSWVPDFSVPFERHQLQRVDGNDKPVYTASGGSQASVKWSIDSPTKIGLDAFIFDNVVRMTSKSSGTSLKVVPSQTKEWATLIGTMPSAYPSGGTSKSALWRTLIGDVLEEGTDFISPAPRTYGKFYESMVHMLELEHVIQNENDLQAWVMRTGFSRDDIARMYFESQTFMNLMSLVQLLRRLAVTEKGYLCAVPVSTDVGDRVCVLKGGGVPFVLRAKEAAHDDKGKRRADSIEHEFELVGECYIHGMMNGEALKRPEFGWTNIALV